MFKISKYFFYTLGSLIFLSKMFACSGGGGGCVPLELIPEGYRAEQYHNNPIMKKATQVRITNHSLTFIKENLGTIIKTLMPEMYLGDDANGNPRIKFCMPPSYGVKSGFEYGIASDCDHDNCDICEVANGSNGDVCPEASFCSNGEKGFDIEITLKNIVIEPQDKPNTDADLIHTSVDLEIIDIPFWVNGVWPTDNDGGNTSCQMEIPQDVPVTLNIDFIIPHSELEEITFNIDTQYSFTKDHLNAECPGANLYDTVINMMKGTVIDQITPIVDDMIAEFKDTFMCTHCAPNAPNSSTDGFHCPTNAPAGATCNSGGCADTGCDDGFTCASDGLCKQHTNCERTLECDSGICVNGDCVVTPLCMETANTCWKQRLGMDGRVDTMGILSSFMTTEGESWINYYINVAEYAKSQAGGISIGVFGGTSSDYSPCVPESTNHYTENVPELELFNSNEIDGDPYHIGIAVSEYYLNQAFDSIYGSGALCLDIDTKTSSMISSSMFALMMAPSIDDLVEEDSNALIAIRPLTPPIVNLGPGNVDEDNNPVYGESLINLDMNDLSMDFYVFSEGRYVRVFTVTMDLKLGINLEVDEFSRLTPVLAPLELGDTKAIRNIRVTNSDILREKAETLQNAIPVILELALGMMPLEFSAIPLPSFMGFSLENIKLKYITQGDSVTSDFLGIFTDIGIGGEVRRPHIDGFSLKRRVLPKLRDIRKGKKVKLDINLNLDDSTNVETQYRVDGGFWTPFKPGSSVKVTNAILTLQGKHNIEMRSRYMNKPKSLSKIKTYTIITDTISPKVSIKRVKNNIVISGKDNFTNKRNISWMINIDDNGWKSTKNLTIPINNRKDIFVQVKAKDEKGNENMITRRFNFNNNKVVSNVTETSEGCSYGSNNSSNAFIFIVFILAFFSIRKRKAMLLLFASIIIGFSGCDSTEKNSCVYNEDCNQAGYICVDNKCVESQCEEGSTEYKCTDCYIPGRCTAPTGDNPCNVGCECNEVAGTCLAIDGYCDDTHECEDDSYECKDNKCVPKRCTDDTSCSAHECANEHANPYCDQDSGACRCAVPCGGSCGDGKFCCKAKDNPEFDNCLTNPEACTDYECDPGYEVNVVNEGSVDGDVTCDLVGVECNCKELPHLKLGIVGKFTNTLVWKNKLVLVGYNATYQDLVIGTYDEAVETLDNEHIKWTFLDGILNEGETEAEITNGPTGPRGGVSQLGDNVGQYASAVVDSNDRIHVSYYDKTNGDLKYAIITENTTDENKDWDIQTLKLDTEGNVGLYTSITIDNTNKPVITYTATEVAKNDSFFSILKVAIASSDTPLDAANWQIETLEEVNKDLPCNRSCGDDKQCLFDETAVELCNSRTTDNTYSNNSSFNIPDNNPEGVISTIHIPNGVKAIEFKLNLNISHAFVGDLKVTLISPTGREVTISNPSLSNNLENLIISNKYLYQFSNKKVSGVWKLSVIDTAPADTGVLNSWSLKVKTLLDSSEYCGADCFTATNDCDPACGGVSGTVCVNGVCLKKATELAAKYYERGTGLFAKSKRFSDSNLLGILYVNSLDEKLKYIHYNISSKTIIETVVLEMGGVFDSGLSILDDNVYATFKDNMGNLRYLKYTPQTNVAASVIIDDGTRSVGNLYQVNKVGTDSIINKIASSENLEMHYMDATTHKILRKTYNGTSWSDFEIFKDSFNAETYVGSFGFYLNVLYLSGQKVVTSFFYKLQVDGGQESDIPEVPGKVKIIK